MKGESTYLTNPDDPSEEPKKFTFDFSYWSHDGFEEKPDGYLAGTVPHYADQVRVLYSENTLTIIGNKSILPKNTKTTTTTTLFDPL